MQSFFIFKLVAVLKLSTVVLKIHYYFCGLQNIGPDTDDILKILLLRSVNKYMHVMLFTTSAHAVKLRCVWEGPGLILISAIMLNNQPDQSAASNYTAVPITSIDSSKQICSSEWWGAG